MRQPPSDGNALGKVKFMFPNPYNIYLHDTPHKELFVREANTLVALSHPHIVKLFDYGHQDGIVYFVMELMVGGSLAEHLANGVLPLERADALIGQHSLTAAPALRVERRRGGSGLVAELPPC
mgnify:CR=1 FL=1